MQDYHFNSHHWGKMDQYPQSDWEQSGHRSNKLSENYWCAKGFLPDCHSRDRSIISHPAALKKGITFCGMYSTPSCSRKGHSSASELLCFLRDAEHCTSYSKAHNFWGIVVTQNFSSHSRLRGMVERLSNISPKGRNVQCPELLKAGAWFLQSRTKDSEDEELLSLPEVSSVAHGSAPHPRLRASYHILLLPSTTLYTATSRFLLLQQCSGQMQTL